MPPSGRKPKSRVRRVPVPDTHEPSDIEAPDAMTTPSRATRKRARGSDAPPAGPRNMRRKTKDTRVGEREGTAATEPLEHSDAETEPAVPTEDDIIAHLKVADRHVNATEDFANDLLEGQEHVPGYGKIAGRDWAFIIRKVEVNIGRPEAHDRLQADEAGPPGLTAKTVVDIDLGPDRQVSRSHAIISYDSDTMQWLIIVNSRNGVRVDNNLLKRGTKSYLRSGNVIEIANTQMAFITTATDGNQGPEWHPSIVRQAQKSSEEDEDGDVDPRSIAKNRTLGHPAPHFHLQDSVVYDGTEDAGPSQHRTHTQSTRNAAPPGTPVRGYSAFPKSSPAANYSRGVMMESTESIDYSAEGAKDLKPPHSYAQMIGMAILSTPEQQMTLSNIYKWIMANYAFYRFNTGGWQNSIRHNLSLNKAFTKIARRMDEPGKGMKWMIEPSEFEVFVQQGMKGCRRPQLLPGTHGPTDSPRSPPKGVRAGGGGCGATTKKDDDTSPALSAYKPVYPSAMEAYTPDRESTRAAHTTNGVGLDLNRDGPEYDYLTRSTPRNNLTAMGNAAGSPPALYVGTESRTLDTPFPLRPTLRPAPPSTLRRPSDYIQFSSPAPFWKMEGLVGSTPFKPYDLSPLKTPFTEELKKSSGEPQQGKGTASHVEKATSPDTDRPHAHPPVKHSPVIHSSSPPGVHADSHIHDASPTMSRPATAVAKTLGQLAGPSKEGEHEKPSQASTAERNSESAPVSATTIVSNPFPAAPSSSHESPTAHPYAAPVGTSSAPSPADDGEDEGIDLAK